MSPRVPKPQGEPNPKPVTKRRPRTTKPVVPAKHPGGRPSKYTEEIAASICRDLEVGNMRRAVAAAHGIAASTLSLWIDQMPEFSERVRKAEAVPEYRCVIKIMLGKPGWQAAAWWLERKWHMDWGRRERVDMMVDTRKSAEKALAEAGLPSDEESIARLVEQANEIAVGQREEERDK